MENGRVLVTMFNRAPWGGLHENVLFAAQGMRHAHGWDVTVACREGPLVERLTDAGVGVHVVRDWANWEEDAGRLSREHWDIVHSHPFRSRELALGVVEATGAKLVSTFHGFNRDQVYRWADRASSFVAVSRSHAAMVAQTRDVDPARVFVVPNALPDHVHALEPRTWSQKTSSGTAQLLIVSRLDPDKRALLGCLEETVEGIIAGCDPGLQWTIRLLGAGADAAEAEAFLLAQAAKSSRFTVEYVGWVDSEAVPSLVRDATLAIASGRGAAQALAVGTPVVAFGSQGVYGLQYGANLKLGLWGNFGGYPLAAGRVTSVFDDVRRVVSSEGAYAAVQANGKGAARAFLRQIDADAALDGIYRVSL